MGPRQWTKPLGFVLIPDQQACGAALPGRPPRGLAGTPMRCTAWFMSCLGTVRDQQIAMRPPAPGRRHNTVAADPVRGLATHGGLAIHWAQEHKPTSRSGRRTYGQAGESGGHGQAGHSRGVDGQQELPAAWGCRLGNAGTRAQDRHDAKLVAALSPGWLAGRATLVPWPAHRLTGSRARPPACPASPAHILRLAGCLSKSRPGVRYPCLRSNSCARAGSSTPSMLNFCADCNSQSRRCC